MPERLTQAGFAIKGPFDPILKRALADSGMLGALADGVGNDEAQPDAAGRALGDAIEELRNRFSVDSQGGWVKERAGDLRLVANGDGVHDRIEVKIGRDWIPAASVGRDEQGARSVDGTEFDRAGLGEPALPPGWGIVEKRADEAFPNSAHGQAGRAA